MWHRRFRSGGTFIATTVLAGLLLGCAGTARQDSIELAKAGVSVASAAQSDLVDLRNSLDQYVQGQLLSDSIETGGAALQPDEVRARNDQIGRVRQVQHAIMLREQALANLSGVYLSFQKLGEYDAAGAVETSMNSFTEAVNELGTAVGSNQPPLSNVAGGFIGKGAGLFAGEVQAGMLRAASPQIRARLERFRDHLVAQQKTYQSMRTVVANRQKNTAQTLYRSGIGDPTPVFRDLLSGYGINYPDDESAAAALQKLGEPGHKAMGEVIAFRAESSAYFEESILTATIGGMNSLIQQHLRLEQGDSLSLTGVSRDVAVIQSLVDDYVKWRELDKHVAKKRKDAAAASTQPQ